MLDGKVIIITGAGSGIGRAAAKLFVEAGARIVISDVDAAGLAETGSLIGHAESVEARRADIATEAGAADLVTAATGRFGRLDGAFNNAGVPMQNIAVHDLTLDAWRRVNDVNATGTFLCVRAQINAMKETGGGAIVNTASANAIVAQAYSAEYVASKHSVLGLTRAASTEAALTGVRINAVLPGMIQTPMLAELFESEEFQPHREAALARHTIGRFGTPEDVAYVARFLLSDQSSFVNGAAWAVDGGYTAR